VGYGRLCIDEAVFYKRLSSMLRRVVPYKTVRREKTFYVYLPSVVLTASGHIENDKLRITFMRRGDTLRFDVELKKIPTERDLSFIASFIDALSRLACMDAEDEKTAEAICNVLEKSWNIKKGAKYVVIHASNELGRPYTVHGFLRTNKYLLRMSVHKASILLKTGARITERELRRAMIFVLRTTLI
jgi:hypothetical protein